MPRVLLLTGPAGSGKTTVSTLLAARPGWTCIAEDDIWPRLFGKDRGAFGSDEHRRKRAAVHAEVEQAVLDALAQERNVVIDATVHETPPEAFREYEVFSDGTASRGSCACSCRAWRPPSRATPAATPGTSAPNASPISTRSSPARYSAVRRPSTIRMSRRSGQ